ncbi:MAG: TetR/AcrR family transcriptional regulator [Nocardioidaceae bacterium]
MPTPPRDADRPATPPARRLRLSADDRRRQLVGIGLAKLVDKPIQDLPLDEVATEAGISRGLLFHYFPTKRDFYRACVEAAARRILRTTAPDPDLPPEDQVRQMVRLFVEQIDRRREFYLSLLHGTGSADVSLVEVYDGIWTEATTRVMDALALREAARPVVHAWWAYVEDRALTWSGTAPARRDVGVDEMVEHGVTALRALVALESAGP